MKALPWILAGVGASVATYMLTRRSAPLYSTGTGFDSVDTAAGRTASWGDRQRIAGAGSNLAGKVKEGLGRLTGNESLASEGTADQAAGSLRNATGTVANAASQTLRDLNF